MLMTDLQHYLDLPADVPRPAQRSRSSGNATALYWHDRHLRFHSYARAEPSDRVGGLFTAVERNPPAFWG